MSNAFLIQASDGTGKTIVSAFQMQLTDGLNTVSK